MDDSHSWLVCERCDETIEGIDGYDVMAQFERHRMEHDRELSALGPSEYRRGIVGVSGLLARRTE